MAQTSSALQGSVLFSENEKRGSKENWVVLY